jgi:hypothetical protein
MGIIKKIILSIIIAIEYLVMVLWLILTRSEESDDDYE